MTKDPDFLETLEVHLRRDGKWTIHHAGLGPTEARQLSEEAFRGAGVDGVRIVRSCESVRSGTITEETIVEKTRKLPDADAIVGVIADAPYCETVENLFEIPARYCLYRLFKGWLETHEVGVSECLISPKLIERLLDRGSLVQTAAQRVASLQTSEGEDTTERRDQLLALIDRLREAAARTGDRAEADMREGDSSVAERVTLAQRENNFILAVSQITVQLAEQQNRLAKIERLFQILDESEGQEVWGIVDLVLSDFLMDEEVALEFAGPRAFPIECLDWIACAAQGTMDASHEVNASPHEFADPILTWIADDRLPGSRRGLLIALEDMLRGTSPLHDGTPGLEKAAVLKLTRRLASSSSFAGGAQLAARLTHRFAEFEELGGASGFLEAVESLVLDLNDIHCQTRYLFALLSGSNSNRVKRGLMAAIDRCFRLYGGLDHLVKTNKDIGDLVRELDGICLFLETIELGPKSREAWIEEINCCFTDAVTIHTNNGLTPIATLSILSSKGEIRSETVAKNLQALTNGAG